MKKEKANKLKCTQIDQLSYNSSFKNSRAKKVVAGTSKFRGIEAICKEQTNVFITLEHAVIVTDEPTECHHSNASEKSMSILCGPAFLRAFESKHFDQQMRVFF